MLSFSSSPPSGAPSPWIKDVSMRTFMADVVEASMHKPIIVDFWAPWCAPCKQLTPDLERAIHQFNGALHLAKINVDENPQIAQQLRIQSLPTIFVFYQRQPVDMFTGLISESQILALFKKLVDLSRGIPELLEEAKAFTLQGHMEQAEMLYQQILAAEPHHIKGLVGLARCLLERGEIEGAEALFAQLPEQAPDLTDSAEIKALATAIQLAHQGQQSQVDLESLREKAQASPEKAEPLFKLAEALFLNQSHQEAIDILVTMVRDHGDWEGGKAKAQLLTFFESLGFSHPMSVYGRKELSKVLFS